MFGFKRKKKDNPVVSGTKFPKTLGVPDSVPVLNFAFMEDSSHINRVSLRVPGRTTITDRNINHPQSNPINRKAEAKFLFRHVNHVTGNTHTISEIMNILGVSRRTVYTYLEGLPKKKKREYNAKRG